MGKDDPKEDVPLTKKKLAQALTKFGADQEERLTQRLQGIANQVNLTMSGTKSLLKDHAIKLNALTDFACANLAELVVLFDDLVEKIKPETTGLDELREKIREKITFFQTELKAYQDHAQKRMSEMVQKAQESIAPPEAEKPKVKRIDLSDGLPMNDSLEVGAEKTE